MGKKTKVVKIDPSIIDQVISDISGDNIKFYKTEALPEAFVSKELIHPSVADKSSTFSLACSGCPSDDRVYMYLCAHREDHGEIDLDPICFAYTISTETPSPSGVVSFHGQFEGRTSSQEEVTEMIDMVLDDADEVTVGFEDVSKSFSNAMHHMAEIYRKKFDD